MKVTITVEKNIATVAIQYELKYGAQVKSKKRFKEVIAEYISEHGESNIDDHESEYDNFREEAEKIVDKYFE